MCSSLVTTLTKEMSFQGERVEKEAGGRGGRQRGGERKRKRNRR